MSEQRDGTVDDWLGRPEASLAPQTPSPAFRSARGPLTPARLRDELANAPEAPATPAPPDGPPGSARPGPDDAQPGPAGGGAPPADPPRAGSSGGGDRKRGEIFEGCPVTPLGVRGDYAYFLDANGQQRRAKDIKAQVIQSLFGHRMQALCYNFPVWENTADKGDPPVWQRKTGRFDQTSSSMVMWEAASECGIFDPDAAVRGTGAWADDDGHLVYHLGNRVLYRGAEHPPGWIDGRLYPALKPIPAPDFSATAPDPVPDILDTLRSWSWTEPDFHPVVALGVACAQMMGGALDWRPVCWLTAEATSGKSKFQDLLEYLHGPGGAVRTEDATERGITAQLGQDSRPVLIDEIEPNGEGSARAQNIVKLARLAASGGRWVRSSSSQEALTGNINSSFFMSSILIPGIMKPQDIQRLIRLDMRRIEKGAAPLNLYPRTWRARGARLKGLLITRWPDLRERMDLWRLALEREGVGGRAADNWCAVMAMADLAMGDEPQPEDAVAGWARKVGLHVANDRADVSNDAEAMLMHLMGQVFDPWRRGEQYTIAQWVMAAAGLPAAPASLNDSLGSTGALDRDLAEVRKRGANEKLAKAGLRVVEERGEAPRLFIANAPIQTLKDLFRGSDWEGGAWKQSASRVPGAVATPHPLTLAGQRSRGYLIPLEQIAGIMSFPADHVAAQPAPLPDDDDTGDWA